MLFRGLGMSSAPDETVHQRSLNPIKWLNKIPCNLGLFFRFLDVRRAPFEKKKEEGKFTDLFVTDRMTGPHLHG